MNILIKQRLGNYAELFLTFEDEALIIQVKSFDETTNELSNAIIYLESEEIGLLKKFLTNCE